LAPLDFENFSKQVVFEKEKTNFTTLANSWKKFGKILQWPLPRKNPSEAHRPRLHINNAGGKQTP